ncbi:GNAT family N-acetyltransferase [Lentibacillus sp. CBA3610]|uniref:GNAT family N-acetyltransferase n=1 Tax=Lentibacillus sp. CBA3610 TaxID=2518176 RepID=UPI001594FDFD|nr:GNAT family N-acetyltransferase [Lentibacillus sp. CBA3610]QKY71171.1 GNAT family N-acetyltransferase [Lentibacillus sp. CBA3610]
MDWYIKAFQKLTNDDLYAILKLRMDIFVVEQECHYPELDNHDQEAIHYFLKDGHDIVANARILPKNTMSQEASIGRVAVAEKYRSRNYGRLIMQKAIDYISGQWNESVIKIEAQAHLKKFYADLGFRQVSEPYLDDGIPHVDMIWKRN